MVAYTASYEDGAPGLRSGFPLHLSNVRGMVGKAREDEQQIGQPVQIDHAIIADILIAGEANDNAFCTAAYGTGEVETRGNRRTTRKDETLQRFEVLLDAIDRLFDELGFLCTDTTEAFLFKGPWRGQIRSQHEKLILYDSEDFVEFFAGRIGPDDAEHRIQFIHRPIRFDALGIFGDALPSEQGRIAFVP